MSSIRVAGRAVEDLAGRDICNGDCHAINKARIIYSIVITIVFVIGLGVSAWLIIRQRRRWRRKQELGQVFVPPQAGPSDPPYDPSVGRPVQHVGPGIPPPAPPAYSAV